MGVYGLWNFKWQACRSRHDLVDHVRPVATSPPSASCPMTMRPRRTVSLHAVLSRVSVSASSPPVRPAGNRGVSATMQAPVAAQPLVVGEGYMVDGDDVLSE